MTRVLVLSGLLLLYGALFNRSGWTGRRLYVPVNLAVGALLVGWGRLSGLSWSELGVGGVGPGLVWGLALAVGVALGLGVVAALAALRPFLLDRRIAHLTPEELRYQVLVRIPLGTALAEEVLFRGVLLGVWMAEASVGAAVAGSSVVFGLWHVVPSMTVIRLNWPSAGRRTLVRGTVGAVVATGLAGVGLCWVRFLSGGVVGPVVVHAAANSLGALVSHRLQQEG